MGVVPHIYFLAAASSLKVVLSTDAPREEAADVLSPSVQIAASLETSGVGAAKADIDNPEAGFWTLLWKQPSRGAVSNVWLKIDSDGPKWVAVDPVRPVVLPVALIPHNQTQPLDAG